MLASVSPQEALDLLKTEHEAIRYLIRELSNEEMTRPDTIRYGLYADQQCSFKDLLAHLITYEVYALEAIAAWRVGEKHWISDAMASYQWGKEVHYRGIESRRSLSLQALLDEWESTQADLEATFANFTEEEWRGQAPYEIQHATDFGGMLEAILVAPPRPMYRHLPVHIPDSAAYIQSLRS